MRIWSESGPTETGKRELRGHITDAYTKERSAVKNLTDILHFIQPYAKAMGIKMHARTRLALALSGIGGRRRARQRVMEIEMRTPDE